MKIKIKRFDKSIPLPQYEKRDFRPACFDFKARLDVTVAPKTISMVPLNTAIEVPEGYAMMFYVRSSTPMRKGLMAASSVGILDAFFCGDKDENIFPVYNFTDTEVTVKKGDHIVQAMLIKVENVEFEEVDHMEHAGVGGYVVPPRE